MKLLTIAIQEKLLAGQKHSTEKIPLEDKKVIVKFFCPWNGWTWFVFEGMIVNGDDWEFFGMVHGQTKEMGYFHLSELASITGMGGLKIERDMSVSGECYGSLR